ncbi:MAG TPA: glucokinase, partial [Burkholderiales bacterium]|nr:glucokinase [Burkholderiales bacterium]
VGDIGGTHAVFELFDNSDAKLRRVHEHSYHSRAFPDFAALLSDFLAQPPVRAAADAIDAACFSVAGPVEGSATTLTNLDWRIDAPDVSARFDLPEVLLVNDFAAVGHGIGELGEHDMITLQRAVAQPHGTRLVVGAGTGLGVCILTWQTDGYAVHASEAGHTDFAPLTETQDELLASLRKAFGRVSYERVVSGPGLLRIFSFLQNCGAGMPSRQLLEAMQNQDEAAAISEFAINKLDPLAARALGLFVEIYGAFAGNMALATLARGGVYIAGGIARQIARKLGDGSFVRAFTDKGRFGDFLRRYPLHIVTDPKVGLKGALVLIRRSI